MSLSKQLYIIISLIFFMIFAGNFIISVNNTKDYIQTEAVTKAQDTATSLGMTLKPYMKNKKDPEIVSIINAIANRGFYKELRLEDVQYSFTADELIEAALLDVNIEWSVSDVSVDAKFGEIITNDDQGLGDQLAELEELEASQNSYSEPETQTYVFIPEGDFKEGQELLVKFSAVGNDEIVNTVANIKMKKVLVDAKRDVKFDRVPQWFIDMIEINLPETKSEISDGWKVGAVIYVSANPGDAYDKLYLTAKGAIIYAAIAFTIAIALLVLFLQFILKPLRDIEILAQNIAKGKFEQIKNLPWTTEIKNITITMNDMSAKIEGIIAKLNSNLETMTKKLSEDGLTGLQMKQTFETDMKKMFISSASGYIFSIKIDNLGEFALHKGNKAVDNFVRSFANILKNADEIFKAEGVEISAYRFFGSEFAMIAKGLNYENAQILAQNLQRSFEQLGEEVDKPNICHIGGTPFNPIGTTPGIWASANEAYELAKQVGPNEVYIRDDNDLAHDMEEWRDLVLDIIEQGKFEVGYISGAYGLKGENENILLMEEAFTSAKDNNGADIPIGTFVSIAEKYLKVIDFDKAVVQKVIKHIETNNIEHSISINLSLDSIHDHKFTLWLIELLKAHQDIVNQLVFSITAYGAAKDLHKFKEFIDMVHQVDAKIILKRFESKFIPLDEIKNYNLDYIRLARDYTNGISKDGTKRGFVESMQELAGLLNIKVFAENVKEDDDFNAVKEIELYGASR